MKKIYCFNNGGSPGWYQALAICEDGHVLGQHICSHERFMRHDLGMDGSNWKHENYNAHCGPGNWELEWVDDPENHEALKKAFDLNVALAVEAAKSNEQTEEQRRPT